MRVSYWDNWKGIAIIAVVAIHASGTTSTFPEGSFNWDFGLVFRQFINFAVPIFFGLSGFFAARYAGYSAIALYKSRLGRIIYPYIAWTVLYLLVRTPMDFPTTNEIFQGILLGNAIGIGYFVVVLLQFTILTPIFNVIENPRTHVKIIILGFVAAVALNYCRFILEPDSLLTQFPQNAILFIFWYPFFHLGYFLARYNFRVKINRMPVLVLSALCLAVLEGFFWGYKDQYSFGTSQLKLTSFILSGLLLLFIILRQQSSLLTDKTILTWIGINSYAIYLIHMLALRATRAGLDKVPGLYELQPLYIGSATVITISLTSLTIIFIKLLIPKFMHQKILG